MSLSFVEIVLLKLDSESQGHVEMNTVASATISKTVQRTLVKTMNAHRRAMGTISGTPEFSMDLECYLERGANEVDWDFLWEQGEEFNLIYEKGIGGERRQAIDCTVNEFSIAASEAGETKASIKITYRDDKSEL